METAVFGLFALLALGSSVVVIAHKSPIYSTLSLVLTLFSVAVLFVLLGAPFIATLQLLIYTGAILVLFLFVIMLLNIGRDEGIPGGHRVQLVTAIAGALVLAGMLALLLRHAVGGGPHARLTEEMVSLSGLAQELFTAYLLPFEIVGLLLLVAVIAATVIARRPTPEELAAGAAALPLEAAAPAAPGYAAWALEADRAAGGATPASVRGGLGASGSDLREVSVSRRADSPRGRPGGGAMSGAGLAAAQVPVSWYLLLSAALFAIGTIGALTRRNGISIFLSIEVMLNAANLALVAYSRQLDQRTGQILVFFVLAVAAAEAAVGLALFIAVYRQRRTIDVNRMNLMRH